MSTGRSEPPPDSTGACGRAPPEWYTGAMDDPGSEGGGSNDRFVDCGLIGVGGMGLVHRIYDRRLGRYAARKTLRPDGDEGTRRRFANEARILGRLEHPNIVPVYDLEPVEEGEPTWFVMKLVEGETLTDRIGRRASSPPDDGDTEALLEVVLKVCDAVAFAHGRGVIHRDINPANVMTGSHGQAYLMDWGLARERGLDDVGDPEASLSGTLGYMAPEQAWGESWRVDERTDVFGVGSILYAILTSRAPHHRGTPRQVLEASRRSEVPAPEDVSDRPIPGALSRIAMRALSRDPSARHASIEELRREIEEFLRGGGWFPVRRFAAGETILREGDRGDCAYIIRTGRCEVVANRNGEATVIRTVGPGEVVGEIALFGVSPRVASVRASSDVALLLVDRAALDREVARTSWVRPFLRALADRFAESEWRAAGQAVS